MKAFTGLNCSVCNTPLRYNTEACDKTKRGLGLCKKCYSKKLNKDYKIKTYKPKQKPNKPKINIKDKIKQAKKRREYYINYRNTYEYKKSRKIANKKYFDKIKKDPYVILSRHLRRRLSKLVLSKTGIKPDNETRIELCGCSILSLRNHLQSLFYSNMSWENYGEWHIDHIIPCASFDLTDPEQQKKCFHYTNLQPLWASDNLSKGDRLDWVKASSQ